MKYTSSCSQVKWAPDNLDGYLNFFSISADGRVTNWTIVKSKLWSNDILEIPFSKPLSNLENVEVNLLDGGQAFAFKPDDDSKFLVGTDLGLVYYCTTEYCSEFLARFRLSRPIRALHFPLNQLGSARTRPRCTALSGTPSVPPSSWPALPSGSLRSGTWPASPTQRTPGHCLHSTSEDQ